MSYHFLSAAAVAIVTTTALAASPARTGCADPSSESIPDTLQTRPLRLLMVGLGQDMSRIADGIWHEDLEMIKQGAHDVADHPRVTPDEMAKIKAALGEQFAAFVAFDRLVHDTANELAGTARAGNMARVLEIQNRLQQGCVSCHTAFREEVRRALY